MDGSRFGLLGLAGEAELADRRRVREPHQHDVSAVADPATGVAVYDTYDRNGWLQVGGTSVARRSSRPSIR